MSEGMALALPSLHEGIVQGKDHPRLPHSFGRASSLNGLAMPQVSRCLLTVGRSPSLRFPGQWLCWLVPRVYRELLTPQGRKGLPVCSSASALPCVACIISTQRATLHQSQLGTPSLQTSAQRKDLVGDPSLLCCTEWGAEVSRYQFSGVHAEKQVLTKCQRQQLYERDSDSSNEWVYPRDKQDLGIL